MYKHHHDWIVEVVSGPMSALDPDAEIEPWAYDTAASMIHHSRNIPAPDGDHNREVVTRDVVDTDGSLMDRSWAYMHRGEDGKLYLPDDFLDAAGVKVAPVPQYLRRQLANAQA